MFTFENLILLVFQVAIIMYIARLNNYTSTIISIILIIVVTSYWILRYETITFYSYLAHLRETQLNEKNLLNTYPKINCSKYIFIKNNCEEINELVDRFKEKSKIDNEK